MALIGSRKLWVLVLLAGGVLAAMTAIGRLELPSNSIAVETNSNPAAQQAKGLACDGLGIAPIEFRLDEPALQALAPTGAPLPVKGIARTWCPGQSPGAAYLDIQMSLICDGVEFSSTWLPPPDGVTFDGTGSFHAIVTTPNTPITCDLRVRAWQAGDDGSSEAAKVTGPVVAEVTHTVQFVSPAASGAIIQLSPMGSTLIWPDTANLFATVSLPAPLSIAKVEFFDESALNPGIVVKLGEDTQAPYQLEQLSLEPADHLIYAVATDSRGYKAISERVRVLSKFNQAPEVSLNSPSVGARFQPSAPITIGADIAIDRDCTGGPLLCGLDNVKFFADGALLHQIDWMTGPETYRAQYVWQGASLGAHAIFVEAQDRRGSTRRVGPMPITVEATSNASPTAKIVSPLDGLFMATNMPVPLSASATDDSIISQIDFVIAPWPGSTGQVVVAGAAPAASAMYRNTWTFDRLLDTQRRRALRAAHPRQGWRRASRCFV